MPVYTFAADKDIEFTYRAKVTSGTVHETLLTQAILGEMKDGAIVPVSSFKPVESPAGQVLYGSKDTEFDITCRFYAGTLQPGIYLLKMHGTTTLCDNDMGLLVITAPLTLPPSSLSWRSKTCRRGTTTCRVVPSNHHSAASTSTVARRSS